MVTSRTDDRRRPERVASVVREGLTTALLRDLADPRLQGVVVSTVDVTDDLSLARVGIVVLADDPEMSRAERACKVLTALEGGLRKRLAPRLGMRRMLSLRFYVDRGRIAAERLDALLHEVSEELRKKQSEG